MPDRELHSWDAKVAVPLSPPNAALLASVIQDLDAHAQTLTDDAKVYWRVHKRRFSQLGELLLKRYSNGGESRPPARILDVGQSYQTLLVAKLFPESELVTLGFQDNRYKPKNAVEHIQYDLNDAYFETTWPKERGFDLVLFLEVIEHLYTSPRQTLKFIKTLLVPRGVIMISTPNALFLGHRISLLMGRHPFEMIRDSRINPGHFREYTRKELLGIGKELNLAEEYVDVNNVCLGFSTKEERLYHRVTTWLPQDFRQMMTIVFCRLDE